MIEEISANLFRLESPIPQSPLKATNAYVVKGSRRALMIDSGPNYPESLAAIRKGLAELCLELSDVDLFLTHMHADHSGLLQTLDCPGLRLFAHPVDAKIINQMFKEEDPLADLREAACQNGFEQQEAEMAIRRHPGNDIGAKKGLEFLPVMDGDLFEVGEYRFRCIATPGHTQGHLCLYEPIKKMLISGDHILGDISPNITYYWGEENPLQEYLTSLELIRSVEVDLVLPGHRRIFEDCHGRIEELKNHHRQRLRETFEILSDRPQTAYEVAACMTWDMVFNDWCEVAPIQKFFATGEALAHLRFLQSKGNAVLLQAQNKYCWKRG